MRVPECVEVGEGVELLREGQAGHIKIVRMLMDEVLLAARQAHATGWMRHDLGHSELKVLGVTSV